MKTKIKKFSVLGPMLILVIAAISLGCSKDDSQDNNELVPSPGTVQVDDFEAFEGEIGIAIDARPVARKGYTPAEVTLNVDATHGNYTQTIPLDEFSLMGQLKVPLEGLSEAAKNELENGVSITPIYKDASGNTIYTEQAFTQSFVSNPVARSANAVPLQETEDNQELSFNSGSPYYIQYMNADGNPESATFTITSSAGLGDVISATESSWQGNEPNRNFTFFEIPNEPNTFAIRHVESLKYLAYKLVFVNTPNAEGSHFGLKLTNRTSLSQIQNSTDYNDFKFTIERLNNGSFIIKNRLGQTLKQVGGFGLTFDDTITNIAGSTTTIITASTRAWRMISRTTDWSISNIGTTFLEPILPPAETTLSFNSILTNCGNGTLTQSVGQALTTTQNITVGFEETLSMSTTNTVSVGVSVDVEFSAQILGTGTNVNTNVSTNYEHSWSQTSTNSNWSSMHTGETLQISTSREVTVPSGSASLVYDVYQYFPETRVNFVQRLRVEGVDSTTGLALTGEEIRTQFYVTGFNGVVTEVEANSIVVSLRGTLTLDRILESESNVQDVPANCN